jgi:phenylalanyl-tRNA synthetase beta chain
VRIVLSWLREFAPTELPAEELAELITPRGVMVEEILRPWEGIQGVTVARVLEVGDHPNADTLCVARVDDGTGAQTVCAGVRNFVAGDLVPWAKPGARVPVLPEPLAPRKLRGVVSNGMLCSPKELAVADVHTGILILNDEDVQVGSDFAVAFGLSDAVFDIEVEPNRPDFLSVFGVAREVSAATGVPLVSPDLSVDESVGEAADLATVQIDAPDGCPRYLARVIRGVDPSRRSPVRVQARLTASGMRPLSAIVDATNYAMLEIGQPLHGFDMDELAGPGIVVRYATDGERLTTLDDVERDLTSQDLLICDVERPVAIAGVMGGATSEMGESTTSVLLESAFFTRTGVLRTARRLDLHTEASHRFERGVDPTGQEAGAARCAALMTAWAGGTVAHGVAGGGDAPAPRSVTMRPSRASMLLDYPVTAGDVAAVFDALGMTHRTEDPDAIEVEVPGYRVDIEREVDLIEEVARVQGYDRIGSSILSPGQAGGEPAPYAFRGRLRHALVRAGLREVRLLSFASEEDLRLSGDEDAIPVANPLQADEGFLRTTLIPGLLHAVARNQARGNDEVAIFEIGTVFRLDEPIRERPSVAIALCGEAQPEWSSPGRPFDVLDAKGIVEAMMDEVGVADWSLGDPGGAMLHPGRSAMILMRGGAAGSMGELRPAVARSLEIEGRVAVVELDVDALLAATEKEFVFRDVPRFPPVRRDLAFVVPDDAAAGDVHAAIEAAGGELLARSSLFDVFRGESLPDGTRSLAFALEFRAPDRTLTGEETEPIVARIVARIVDEFGGELRAG